MRVFVAAILLVGGCASEGVPNAGQAVAVPHCTAIQSTPRPVTIAATGCTPPSFDGVHVEVSSSDYAVIVTSPDGFTVGEHGGVYVDVRDGGRSGVFAGSMTVFAAESGWMIEARASEPLDVTLAGE